MSTLNVASRIYVISLPRSFNRRLDMEQIRYTLGLDFTYVTGTEANEDAVHRITKHVAALRANHSLLPPFEWPQDVDELVESESALGLEGSDLWLSDDIDFPDPPSHEPLTCARGNFNLDPYSPEMPPFRVLTKERLACWHSHWRAARLIADGQDDVALILEDDVDMELDIRQRLLGVWDSLPSTWDVVFLGHCWSDEAKMPAIASYKSSLLTKTVSVTSLHPSNSPKCTHAYALSKRGARRLAVYLRYPPFAYSRAIDQAFAWLAKKGKLESYSIVPSLVVQRKVYNSTIAKGKGGRRRNTLTRGVFV
ncbi:hypothetical protein BJ322DRAFT_1004479 [Thelephora terrestris]|uniref:Glycosyl transferase family 25 domain-containing protein n=1 Tax=Thelephora terrestris TaxID=56493 RepID=A0A9P6L703_9AGAM|nr:hypothetical protein BJ322DRAFT_1004479 [Thelephora terrestris]